MPKLKLSPIEDDKPVRVALELPAALHRDLIAYGQILGDGSPVEPARLIVPMLTRFMTSDREFARLRRSRVSLNAHDAARDR